jgi:monothiol glutaredoxin
MDAALKKRLEDQISKNRIMLYMKGTPKEPRCGFSAQVVEILGREGAKFEAFDVLSDETVREGIKEFSDWPTIPQLFIDGEFIGGCDIVTELYQSGELSGLIAGTPKA